MGVLFRKAQDGMLISSCVFTTDLGVLSNNSGGGEQEWGELPGHEGAREGEAKSLKKHKGILFHSPL